MKKKSQDIHPTYKCGKFQHDWAIVDFSTLPQSFRTKRIPRVQKWKK